MVGAVGGADDLCFFQLQQDLSERKPAAVQIALEQILHLGPNNQRQKGHECFPISNFIAVYVKPPHIQVVFQVVEALLHHVPAAVNIQNLCRRLFEVCLPDQEKTASGQGAVNGVVVAAEGQLAVLSAVDVEIPVIVQLAVRRRGVLL